jgi:hypothetical protein
MGGSRLGFLDCHPGGNERRPGSLPRAGRQGQVNGTHADSHVPLAAAQGMERDLNYFRRLLHHTLDFVTDGAFEAAAG